MSGGASSSRGNTPRLARNAGSAAPSTQRLPSAGVLRIQQELRTLLRDPVPFIYVDPDESDVTKISALIVGPLETPYAGGYFRFNLRVVPEYPMKPPKVTFETTDGGRVRFNPNLYDDGNVCLSILGTWAGPAWSSAESLSSVLLSIQSLMCPQPYHNEPGYETRGDPATKAAYNDYIRYETLRVAVVGALNHPSYESHFPQVCDRLFCLWYQMYVTMAKDLQARVHGKSYQDAFSSRRVKYNLTPILDGLQTAKTAVMCRLQSIDTPPDDSQLEQLCETDSPKSSVSYAIDRLQDEHRSLMRQPHPGGSASPRDHDNPFVWDVTILGPENTPWEGGLFSLDLRFSYQHPNVPPFAQFTSKMFHPNITDDGIPALDLIQTRWSASTKVGTILDELQRLLSAPTTVYPVNSEVAHLYRTNKRDYERRVRRIAQDGS